MRVSRISPDGGGNPVLATGLSFPQGASSWGTVEPFILFNGGSAPQAGATTATTDTANPIQNNDHRMLSVFLRNGSLCAAHTVFLNTAGNGDTTQGPINHAAVQWWKLDPAVSAGASVAPLAHGRIQDPAATNCHNGTGGTVGGYSPTGVFYAFPSIAVNFDNDVLLGYSPFSQNTWASGAYSFRGRNDAAGTFQDTHVFRDGLANYNKGSLVFFVTVKRWGDYSATVVDPSNDCRFWTALGVRGHTRERRRHGAVGHLYRQSGPPPSSASSTARPWRARLRGAPVQRCTTRWSGRTCR